MGAMVLGSAGALEIEIAGEGWRWPALCCNSLSAPCQSANSINAGSKRYLRLLDPFCV